MNRFKVLRLGLSNKGETVSQRALSKMIGITTSHISELEKGRAPSFNELRIYHEYFRVSYEYLLGETDEMVCADIYREKPLVETRVYNTLRWLFETDKYDEIELRKTVELLLGEEKGLLLLYYLSNSLHHKVNNKELLYTIEHILSGKYDKFTYSDLRLMMDNIHKCQNESC